MLNMLLPLDQWISPLLLVFGVTIFGLFFKLIIHSRIQKVAMRSEWEGDGLEMEGAGPTPGEGGGWTQVLLQRPKQLGVALKCNKADKKDTRMQMGLHLFEPIRVYFSLLEWPKSMEQVLRWHDERGTRVSRCRSHPGGDGITWLELLLDFWCCTRVEMKPMGCPKPGNLRAQTDLFRAAARRVAQICGERRLTQVAQTHKATSLSAFGQEWAAGFVARPRLLFADMVDKMLKALQQHMQELSPADRGMAFWEDFIPRVEVPDPIWTVDGRYEILTGGTRPGGALNMVTQGYRRV